MSRPLTDYARELSDTARRAEAAAREAAEAAEWVISELTADPAADPESYEDAVTEALMSLRGAHDAAAEAAVTAAGWCES